MIHDLRAVRTLIDDALACRTNDNEAIVTALCAIAVALTLEPATILEPITYALDEPA